MFKKIMLITVVFALVCSLMACGSNSESETGTDPTSTPTTLPTVTQGTVSEEAEPEMMEMVIVDNENVTFKITGIDPNGLLGYTVKIFAENKTDRNLMFSLQDVSVNGFMCDPMWASTVSAGMKSNETITFLTSNLRDNGIETVTRIDFTLNVYNSDDWTEEHLVENTFTVYPLGEEAVEPYERVPVGSDIILVDDETCTVIVTGFDPDSTFGYEMNVYVENRTNKNLMFSASNVAINGFMCDPYWAVTVAPGMRSNSSMTWFRSDLDNNGITQVTDITWNLRVYDSNNWAEDDIFSKTFTVHP